MSLEHEGPAVTPYTERFFQSHREGARRSAEAIVPLVLTLIRPGSVLDIGCGLGTWLAAFRRHGVDDVLGVDGHHVDAQRLEIPVDRFVAADLERPVLLGRQFDLVVSLEVAEHLPETSADVFVDTLTSHGPAVLFSAAIPFQGGADHRNEQWPAYWAERFRDRGYAATDCIRQAVWTNDDVDWWYAQNTLLYVRRDRIDRQPILQRALAATAPTPLGLVHPRKYLAAMEWTRMVREVKIYLAGLAARGFSVILVDQDAVRADVEGPARVVPFCERDGAYWGPPADDATAIAELERLRAAGARIVAFAPPARWWLEHYAGLALHLRSRYHRIREDTDLVVFDLGGEAP
jgi:SAM-dependent methyltransferase